MRIREFSQASSLASVASTPDEPGKRAAPGTPIRIHAGNTTLTALKGEIGYRAPDGDLVVHYDSDPPYFDGIVRIGAVEGDMTAIAQLAPAARVSIDRGG